MKRALAFVLALVAAGASAAAVSVRDDRGARIVLVRPAARIVTLAPHLAEIVFAAGASAKLVGVSAFSRYPPQVERLPQVATSARVDIERLIALRPDLVLAWKSGNPPLQIARIERLGAPVAVTEIRRLEDIARVLRLVGALAGTSAQAEQAALRFEREREALAARYARARPLPLFIEVWHRPMLTVSGEQLASDALSLCGAQNVFADAPVLAPLVSREQLLYAQPQVIVTAVAPGTDWGVLEALPAVRKGRVYYVAPDLLFDQGPRLLAGVRLACRLLDRARD